MDFFQSVKGRKDPFTPATNTEFIAHNNAKEVQIYNADGIAITKGDKGIATLEKQSEFKVETRTTTTQTTINHLIQNPSTHYTKGDGTNNVPIASTTDLTKDWWNPTIKTIYDPCPNGYRIPKSGTYGTASDWSRSTDWGVLTAGYTWGNNTNASFFPASGLRDRTSGKFYAVGSYGAKWMSTPGSATYGHYLIVDSDGAKTNNHFYRSMGMPTRCIKE